MCLEELKLSLHLLTHKLTAVLNLHALVVLRHLLACEVVDRSVSILINNVLYALKGSNHFLLGLTWSKCISLETYLRIALEKPISLTSLSIDNYITPEILSTRTNNPFAVSSITKGNYLIVCQPLFLTNLLSCSLTCSHIILGIVLTVDITLYKIRTSLLGLTINKESCTITLISPNSNLQSTINSCGKLIIQTTHRLATCSRVEGNVNN